MDLVDSFRKKADDVVRTGRVVAISILYALQKQFPCLLEVPIEKWNIVVTVACAYSASAVLGAFEPDLTYQNRSCHHSLETYPQVW